MLDMYAKTILDFIRGKTIDYAARKVERWYREEIDKSEEAFKFLKQDVDAVLDMVYQYHAQVLIAQELLSSRLVENADYLSVCARIPKRRELEDLGELTREVQGMLEYSTGLRTQVRARVMNHIESSQATLDELQVQLKEEEDRNMPFDGLKHTARAIARVSASRDRHRTYEHTVERTGNAMDERLAEALTLLDDVNAMLLKSQDGFATIMKDCNLWVNNWNQWDYNHSLGREVQ